MTDWRWRPRAALVVTVFVLAVQVLVPLLVLLQERGHTGRFGWQMYSLSAEVTRYTVVTDSATREIHTGQVMAVPRGDLPLESLIPPHLCRIVEGAVRVTWDGGEHEC